MKTPLLLESNSSGQSGLAALELSERKIFQRIQLLPDLANRLRSAVREALQDFGTATADSIVRYVYFRYEVDLKKLPLGIERLDTALSEVLGNGKRMVVARCSEIISRELDNEVRTDRDELSDLFREAARIFEEEHSGSWSRRS